MVAIEVSDFWIELDLAFAFFKHCLRLRNVLTAFINGAQLKTTFSNAHDLCLCSLNLIPRLRKQKLLLNAANFSAVVISPISVSKNSFRFFLPESLHEF